MSTRYILSKLALQDQDDIWDYTVENFGIDQAVTAVEEIDRHILLLCDGRKIGRVRRDLAPENHRVWVGPYGYLIIYIPETKPRCSCLGSGMGDRSCLRSLVVPTNELTGAG